VEQACRRPLSLKTSDSQIPITAMNARVANE
jgi:hypothetical protein